MNNTEGFQVKISGIEHSKLLQSIAFKNEYEWEGIGKQFRYYNNGVLIFIYHPFTYDVITHDESSNFYPTLEDYTLDDFIDALNGEYRFNKPKIEILDGVFVDFYPEHVKIGCKELSNNDLKDLDYILHKIRHLQLYYPSKGDLNVNITKEVKQIIDYQLY